MPDIDAVEAQTAVDEPLPSTETAAGDNGAQVEAEATTTSPDAKGSQPSKEQDEKSPLKSSRAAMEILGKDLPEVAPEEQEDEPPKSDGSKPKPVQAKAEAAPKDESADKPKAETDANALFHKRQEWTDLTAVLGEEAAKKARPILRKVLEREVALNAQLRQAQPEVEELRNLRQIVGDEQNWKFHRQVTEGFAKGDPKLLPVLEKMVEQMKARNGLIVQSPDLKARLTEIDEAVTQNQMTPEIAEKWKAQLLEVEKARAGQKMTAAELESQKQRTQQEYQAQTARSNEQALNEWETNVRGKYADFGNVTDENDPQHGVSMADQVMSELSARLQAKPPANQQELVATAQKALEVVERRIKTYVPAPKAMKPVTSEHSSRTAKPAPKSFKEAAESATGILYGSTT